MSPRVAWQAQGCGNWLPELDCASQAVLGHWLVGRPRLVPGESSVIGKELSTKLWLWGDQLRAVTTFQAPLFFFLVELLYFPISSPCDVVMC